MLNLLPSLGKMSYVGPDWELDWAQTGSLQADWALSCLCQVLHTQVRPHTDPTCCDQALRPHAVSACKFWAPRPHAKTAQWDWAPKPHVAPAYQCLTWDPALPLPTRFRPCAHESDLGFPTHRAPHMYRNFQTYGSSGGWILPTGQGLSTSALSISESKED